MVGDAAAYLYENVGLEAVPGSTAAYLYENVGLESRPLDAVAHLYENVGLEQRPNVAGAYLYENVLVTGGGVMKVLVGAGQGSQDQSSFAYTGVSQDLIVPALVTSIAVDLYGAQGTARAEPGGKGGRVLTTLAVIPGEILKVYVGQQNVPSAGGGAFNGGGPGGPYSSSGADGGGATDIRRSPYGLADRLAVAGGGGGAGSIDGSVYPGRGFGGAAGGATGSTGDTGADGGGPGGTGGTQTAGGTGYNNATYPGNNTGIPAGSPFGSNGTFGLGGYGYGVQSGAGRGAGGGGGGYYGGGGGSFGGAGGGGGSSYSSGTGTTNTAAARAGNGLATITYTSPWRKVGCGGAPGIVGRLKALTAAGQWVVEKCDTEIPTFSDNFDRADNPSIVSNGWNTHGRNSAGTGLTWGISSNRAYCNTNATTSGTLNAGMLLRDNFGADFDMSVKLGPETGSQFTALIFAFRVNLALDDNVNGLSFWILNRNNLIYVGSNQGGSTILGSFSFVTNDVVRLVCVGSLITIYKNGVQEFSGTDIQNQSATSHGLASYGANWSSFTFDDFSITNKFSRPLALYDTPNAKWAQVACMVPDVPNIPASAVSSGASQSDTTATPSITLNGIQAGDILVWITGQDADGPAGFTKRQDYNDPGPNNHLEVWTKTATGGESVISTVSQPWHLALAYCFRGVTYDTSAISAMSVATTLKITPSVTAAADGSVVLQIWKARRDSSGVGITGPGGLSNQLLANAFGTIAVVAGWEILPAGATPGRTATSTGSQDWISAVLVLRD